jgi:branched-chain amino acid aminotransferase
MLMNECTGNSFILNGKILPAEMFDDSLVYEGESVYEVLRLIKGKPVFFLDHMERLDKSIYLQGKELIGGISELRESIISLTKIENRPEGNIKIVFNYNGSSARYSIYYTETSYPSQKQYQLGVKGILYHAERRDPASKVINHKLKVEILQKLEHEQAYEAILVNDKNEITEGSRSNIFCLKDETLITAPDNVILNGITRKYILKICAEHGIDLELRCLKVSEIEGCDAIFLTGTSPAVLPFCSIGSNMLRVDFPIIERLRELYLQEAEASIRLF